MLDLRFLSFVLYICIASNIFETLSSIMVGHRSLKDEGVLFDVVYGIMCSLNLVSDIIMLSAMQKPREQGLKVKLRLFLIWNAATTSSCYVTDILLGDFNSQHMALKKEHLKDIDEASARSVLFHVSVFISTATFLVKGGVLCAIYRIHTNFEQLVADDNFQAPRERGPLFAAGAPAGLNFEQGSHHGVAVEAPVGTAQIILPPTMPYTIAASWTSTEPAFCEASQDHGEPYCVTFRQPSFPVQQPHLEHPEMYTDMDPTKGYMLHNADATSSQPILEQSAMVIEGRVPARATAAVSANQPAVGEPTGAAAVTRQAATPQSGPPQTAPSLDTQVPAATAQATTALNAHGQSTGERAMSPQDTQVETAAAKTTPGPDQMPSVTAAQTGPVESTTCQVESARRAPAPHNFVHNSADRDTQAESVAAVAYFKQELQTSSQQSTGEARQVSLRKACSENARKNTQQQVQCAVGSRC